MGFNDAVRTVTVQLSCKHNNESISYGYNNELKELTLERIAQGKFFGVTVAQKLNVKLINSNNDIPLQAGDEIQPWFYSGNEIKAPNRFYITEIHRNENNNELSITAYDAIYFLTNYSYGVLGEGLDTINKILSAIVSLVPEITSYNTPTDTTAFSYVYSGDNKININPSESLRDVLTQICEATQTIAYMTGNTLNLIRLLPNDSAAATIDKSKYFTLSSKDNRRLSGIVSTTELGDNVGEEDVVSGTVVYVNENGFWNLTTDINTLVHNAFTLENGLTVGQFEMEWRGNPTINYGAKIAIEDKQGNYIYSYLLDDTITYNGAYKQKTRWIYSDSQTTEYNSTSIGDAINRTYARVDKVDNRIDLVAADMEDKLSAARAEIAVTTNEISARVTSVSSDVTAVNNALETYKTQNDSAVAGLDGDIAAVRSSTEALQTSTGHYFSVIEDLLDNEGNATNVQTTTVSIDNSGVTVGKNTSSLTTNINENGMIIKDGNTTELTANSQGVTAHNLSADNYLIIDNMIRWQKYKTTRIGCYWIGG